MRQLSNASAADRTAASTSRAVDRGAVAAGPPVAGFRRSIMPPPVSRQSPPTKFRHVITSV
nr:hypothetical protein [Saccharomonospora sp. CUA-673]